MILRMILRKVLRMICLHDEAGGEGEPLVVADGLVVGVPHGEGDEDVEGDGDEDGRDEGEEEEEDEVVLDEGLRHHAALGVVSLLLATESRQVSIKHSVCTVHYTTAWPFIQR